MAPATLIIEVELRGHLTVDSLQSQLVRARSRLEALQAGERVTMIVNALQMSDYDAAARDLFVRFNVEVKQRVQRVAILTDKTLWLMVIAAMALASGQKMRAFQTRNAALLWLSE